MKIKLLKKGASTNADTPRTRMVLLLVFDYPIFAIANRELVNQYIETLLCIIQEIFVPIWVSPTQIAYCFDEI